MGWKNFIVKYKLRALLRRKKEDQSVGDFSLNKQKKVLILTDAASFPSLTSDIKALQKRVASVFCLVHASTDQSIDAAHVMLVKTHGDLNKWGVPTTEIVKKVQQIKADLLIDLTRSSDYAMKYLVASHQAPMKVGEKDEVFDLYNFSLVLSDDKTDSSLLFKQIIHYLDTIHSR